MNCMYIIGFRHQEGLGGISKWVSSAHATTAPLSLRLAHNVVLFLRGTLFSGTDLFVKKCYQISFTIQSQED